MPDINLSSLNSSYPSGTTAQRPVSPAVGSLYFNTDIGAIQIYTPSGWFVNVMPATPVAPTSITATNQGTNRAFNNGQASIAFTPTSTGGTAPTYTVTSSPGSFVGTGSSSPVLVTGLQSNVAYTFTVVANGLLANSSSSSTSNSITATTVPDAPVIGTLSGAGSGAASLTFTSAANGGSAITNYKYSLDGVTYTAFSPAQTTSPLSITGLTDNVSTSIRIKAVNANGDSVASSASNSILPGPTYALALTANNTQNWTVPNGTNYIGVYVVGGGGTGGTGNGSQNSGNAGNGGAGGGGGAGVGFQEYAVNAGTSFLITVGGAGGTSSFGNLASAAGGTASSSASAAANSNVSGAILNNGAVGGAGGNGGITGNAGNAGGNETTIALNGLGIASLTFGGAGGGGGGGAALTSGNQNVNNSGGAGGSGGSPFGSTGGNGGRVGPIAPGNSDSNAGSAGTAPGGGGGGGAGGNGYNYNPNNISGTLGKAGGSGGSGRVLVYTRGNV